LPAININIEFLGNSRDMSLSVKTLFENSNSRFGGSDFSQADMFNLSGSNMFENLISDVRGKLITSVGAYFVTLLLLIISLVFIIIGKFKIAVMSITAIGIALLAYAGNTILSVTEIIISSLEGSLGILALFINLSNMLQITLGGGYWLTIITLGGLLLATEGNFVYGKFLLKQTKIEIN
jgi:hypothetical protein